MNGTDLSVIGVSLNLLTSLTFFQLSPFCNLSSILYQVSFLKTEAHLFSQKKKKKCKLFSASFKAPHTLAPISIQALIIPTLSYKPYVLLLYQTSPWSHEAPGPFQFLFLLLIMPFHLLHLANSQSTFNSQLKVLVKHFLYAPHLSWVEHIVLFYQTMRVLRTLSLSC